MKKPAPQPTIQQQVPVPEPAAPATPTAAEVVKAGEDVRRQQLARKNTRNTIKAGDTMADPTKGAPNAGGKGF